jgi:P27 family predicted phage terminase small subunit
MRGRKPTPTALKLLRGNPGKRPLNAHEPRGTVAVLEPPASLTEAARTVFASVAEEGAALGVVTTADALALRLLAWWAGEWAELDEFIRANGRTYQTTTQSGDAMQRPRPEAAMRAEAARELRQWLEAFGFTPSGRSRVHAVPAEDESPGAAYFTGGRGRRPRRGPRGAA